MIIPAKRDGAASLSFINLIESHVLWSLRKIHHVPLQRIRASIPYLRRQTGLEHPLAELDLATDGHSIFVELMKQLCNATEQGQREMDAIVAPYLKRIERDPTSNMPVRFFPLTRTGPESPQFVVIDPSIAFGRPVIRDTRIETAILFERYRAGDTVAELAEDYSILADKVDEAIRCEIDSVRAA